MTRHITRAPDRAALARFLRRNPGLHLYELGDLDEPFWSRCRWWAYQTDGVIDAVVLEYAAPHAPVIIAMCEDNDPAYEELLSAILDELPDTLHAHVTRRPASLLAERFDLSTHGVHARMVATSRRWRRVDTSEVCFLGEEELDAIMTLYTESYPDHYFDPRALELEQMCAGIWRGSTLAAIAGVHVWAPEQGVASLGNITTHPDWRGGGLARRVTAKLCERLSETVETIGLNVHIENIAARRCYASLGFEDVAMFEEFDATRRS